MLSFLSGKRYNKLMKNLVIFWGGVACLVVLLFGTSAHAVDVNNFTITNYDIQMTLGRDSENRSTLKAVETIKAQFPETDQNHGLERVFVKNYNNHSTSLKLTSVTNGAGEVLPYHWDGDTLRIGNASVYVHGEQTYVITYTQRDVTRYYSDTGKDEFYWDVIGIDWRVPINNATIGLTVDGSLVGAHVAPYCYFGASGASEQCTMMLASKTQNTAGATEPYTYSTVVQGIGNGRGVTVALGFEKGTFAAYEQSWFERLVALWAILQVGMFVISLGLIGWIFARWNRLTSRKTEVGTIAPEYLPPSESSVSVSASVGGYGRSVITAQLLDLAVRHYIKIYEVKEKTFFKPAEYEIEIIKDIGELRWEEQELLKDTFGGAPAVGQRLNLKTLRNNVGYFQRTLNNETDLQKLVRGSYELKEKDGSLKKWLRRVSLGSLLGGVVLVSPSLVVPTLAAFILSFTAYRLTDKGLALKRYLEGLKMYIQVAETERIKMLQSPEGAEKVAGVADGTDSAQLVKLYERVLPYAVLFGQEKEWNKQLGSYYETAGSQPDWYSGRSAMFNAAAFSTAMSSFSTAAVSSASSSTGGSGGGGSSGGGGGGGGGGGW